MAYITQSAQHPVVKIMKVLLIILVLVASISIYLYLNPSIWQSWVKGTPLEARPSVTTVYKWQDAGGKWQITDKPPPAGVDYEMMRYRSDANVMPLVPGKSSGTGN